MKKIEKWLAFIVMAIVLALNVGAETAPVLPALAVTVDDYVYGSERSTPSVSGNEENGAESYFIRQYSETGNGAWREISQRPVTLGMPTEGGRYELKVTVGATKSYSGGSAFCDFYVLPTDLEIGLSVKESIYFGDSCLEGGLFSLADLLGRDYAVTFSERGKNAFTAAPPSEIGSYTVKISVAASSNYNATEKTADFEIKKRSVGGELTLDDLTVIYGKETVTPPLPTYTGDSELVRNAILALTPITEYRPLGSDSPFSSDIPTEVGEYEMRVSLGESKNLHAAAVTAVLRIAMSPISPSVSINGWVYGETPCEPRLSDGSNPGRGRVYYYYKPDGGEYSAAFPTDAGKYTLKVVIEAAAGYSGGECFTEFTIEKAERVDARLVFGDVRYGERLPTPYVSGTRDGAEVTFSYSPLGKNEFTPEPPTESGEYTLRAEIAEGKNFKARTLTFDFIIEKADIYPGVYVENRVYGDTGWTVAVSGNDGGGEYILTYYVKTPSGYAPLSDSEITDGHPFLAGEYKVVCQILESRNHKGSITEGSFTIERAEPMLSVTMSSYTFYSKAPLPTVVGNAEGGDVSFVYYPKGGEISSGSYDIAEIVTSPGEYTVAAVVSQTKNYKTATVSCNFTVLKADLPVSSIKLSVKSGGVEVERLIFGSDFELSLKNNVGYGAVSFSYQRDGGEFTYEKPRAVGKYRVRAEVATTDIYKSLTVFFDLEIVKAERSGLVLSEGEFIFGDSILPALSGNTDELTEGDKLYLYKPEGSDDSEYSPTLPVNAGVYDVKLTVLETDSYLGCEIFCKLTVKKARSVITLDKTEFVYCGEPIVLGAGLNHTESQLIFDGELPTDAGKYTVTVSVPESNNYEAASATFTLTVVAAQGEITALSISDAVWSGQPIGTPTFTVKGDGEVTVEYYSGGSLLGAVPTEVGEYTVRVTLADGRNYKGCVAETSFRIISPTVETTEAPESDGSGGGGRGSLWLILVLAAAIAIAAAIVIVKRSDGGDPPAPAPVSPKDSLPPSDSEGAAALPPTDRDLIAEDKSSDVSDGEKKKRPGIGERIERLTESGKIALDMWLRPEEKRNGEATGKKRGRYAEINIDTLCRNFEDGEVVDLEALKRKGLVGKECKRVKLLGRGELTKNLDIRLDDYSKSAKESLETMK